MRKNKNWTTSGYEALHSPLMTREIQSDNNMVLRQIGSDNSTSPHKAAITDQPQLILRINSMVLGTSVFIFQEYRK